LLKVPVGNYKPAKVDYIACNIQAELILITRKQKHDLKHRNITRKRNNKRLPKGTSKYYYLYNIGVYSNKKGKGRVSQKILQLFEHHK